MLEIVKKMIENQGVYICGDSQHPGATIVIVSQRGRLHPTMLDGPLDPEGFHPTLTVDGPYIANPPGRPGEVIKGG